MLIHLNYNIHIANLTRYLPRHPVRLPILRSSPVPPNPAHDAVPELFACPAWGIFPPLRFFESAISIIPTRPLIVKDVEAVSIIFTNWRCLRAETAI